MSHTGYADAIVSGMLGWLKGFASWVLKLFNLAGSGGISPLKWLSDNWLNMLIVLVVLGVVTDWAVWLIRWRPHWVWFRKKRVVVDDEDFFVGEDVFDAGMYDEKIFGCEALRQREMPEDEPRAKKPNTIVRRDAARPRPSAQKRRSEEPGARTKPAPLVKPKPKARPAAAAAAKSSKRRPAHKPAASRDIFEDDVFKLEPSDAEARRFREDDVFNVSNLPAAGKKKRLGALIVREEDQDDDPFRIG